jgi:excisionase family DNA binding protein
VTDAELTLHEAAEELGVHYMTAYRYVRLGLLHAVKIGGTWRVKASDIARFRGNSATDDAIGAGTSAASGVRDEVGGRRRAPWTQRLEARLVAGDTRGAWGVVEAALAAGAGLEEIYIGVFTPALQSIGARWAAGDLDVSIEHRASVIAMRLIGRLGPRFARRGRTRGVVVLGAPAGERHALPLAMAADLARQQGWEVFDLGADVPADAWRHAVATSGRVIAAGLSISTDAYLESAAAAIAEIRRAAQDVTIVVGGQAVRDAEHARRLGADEVAVSAVDLVHILTVVRDSKMSS